MKWRKCDKAIAYHEASHAVMAVNDGALVRYVELTAGYEPVAGDFVCTGGNCLHQSYKIGVSRAVQNVDVALAGRIGENLYTKPDRKRVFDPRNPKWSERAQADVTLVRDNLARATSSYVSSDTTLIECERKQLRFINAQARQIASELRQWWPSVTALAEELIARCGPSGFRLLTDEIHEILIGANNGIGRDYIIRLTEVYAGFGLTADPTVAEVA
jgi:1,6-anhydro-N-acetylmuramate kinase